MKTELIPVYLCAAFYLINYLSGWLIRFRIISMSKLTHGILFLLIIISLTVMLFAVKKTGVMLFMNLLSLACMLALPFGKKGGAYHIVLSTLGLISLLCVLIVE